ncbi:MAG: thioesterase family protein [Parvularculaceae bacterium]|nr:acyl-CoA thioesterase [Parvularculaceae bacterium]
MTDPNDFAFTHNLRVRWSECDAQGIVFNVNYFTYFDIAVWEWTRALGYATWVDAPQFVTVHAEADYKASAVFDDELAISVRAARLGTKSLEVVTAVFRTDELLNTGKLNYVYVKSGTTETAPLPEEFIERVLAFEKITPVRK